MLLEEIYRSEIYNKKMNQTNVFSEKDNALEK
jgi:hypothetical protein